MKIVNCKLKIQPQQKLLCVVGPTASGKTSLSVKLSKLFSNILVSADSRQVYYGMDIVTGKDHPNNTKIIGLDIVNPDQDCSVAIWHKIVMPHIKKAWKDGKLPIIVGGTGLYIKSLTDNIETMGIPRNTSLRHKLESLSLQKLQEKLSQLDSKKFTSLNQSDVQNPRRLIRAIEVVIHTESVGARSSRPSTHQFTPPNSLIIGLTHSNQDLYQETIKKRVIKRLELGAIQETQNLLEKYSPDFSSFSSLGYKYIIKFLEGEFTHDQMITDWTNSELAYAKRQLTWFKKNNNITWFDSFDDSTSSLVASLVKDWYSN